MEKEMDKIKLQGTSFLIDRERGEFRQENNPANKISFRKFDFTGAAYTANMDERTKKISQDPNLKANPNVIVPAPAVQEPFNKNPNLLSMLNLYGKDHGWGIEMHLPERSAKIIPITQASGFKQEHLVKPNKENKLVAKKSKGKRISS